MSFHYVLIIGIILFVLTNYFTDVNYKKIVSNKFFMIIFLGLVVRIISSIVFAGMENDLNATKNVALFLAENSTLDVYSHFEITSFSPIHLFILYIIGLFSNLVGLNYGSYVFSLLVKLPAIIADVLIAIVIYRIAYKKMDSKRSYYIALCFLLNPLSILMSSVWGLYDSIFILLFILSIDKLQNLSERNIYLSFMYFVCSLMMKPKAIFLLPIFIFVIGEYVLDKKFKDASIFLFKLLITGVGITLIFVLPFYKSLNLEMIEIAITNKQMNYLTINAYNLYGFLRGNWIDVGQAGLISHNTVSLLFLLVILLISTYALFKGKNQGKYYLVASFIIIGTFMFLIRMHEKHMYIGIIFLLLAVIYTRDKLMLLIYGIFSGINFLNCVDAMNISKNPEYLTLEKSIYFLSFVSVILVMFFTIYIIYYTLNKGQSNPIIVERAAKQFVNINYDNVVIEKSYSFKKLNKKDYLYMIGITLIYGVIAFARLGNRFGPYTYTQIEKYQELVVELDAPSFINKIQYLPGPTRNISCTFSFSTNGQTWENPMEVRVDGAFKWDEFFNNNNNQQYSFIKIENTYNSEEDGTIHVTFAEVGFRDVQDEIIKIKDYPPEYERFFDEQEYVPFEPNYYNSGIFDEVYYNQTIANLINKESIFETTHPHLGKYIMLLGVKVFGFNPFGWRFMGTLLGVLMVPVVYVFSKKMFGKSFWPLFTSIIFSFDFMHFVQTRLATIDTYPTFFIMLMFLFMYYYYKMSFYDKDLKKTFVPLFLSGLFMGLGFASKWPTAYGGVGLGIIFFYTIYKRYIEALKVNHMYENYSVIKEVEDIINKEVVAEKDLRKVKNYFTYKNNNKEIESITKENLSDFTKPILEDKDVLKNKITSEGFEVGYATKTFLNNALKTCLACVIFFVIIPTIIYFAAYIPNYNIEEDKLHFINSEYGTNYDSVELALENEKDPGLIRFVIYNQRNMFDFHSQLNDEHPYSAVWWEWLIDLRPILYHTPHGTRNMENKTEVVSAFGNPAVWWVGLVGVMYCFIVIVNNKNKYTKTNKDALFLLIAYLSQLLPWTLITTRTTFIYHYFPCIIFLVLMITMFFKNCVHDKKPKLTFIYLGVVVVLFILFYPALAALVVPRDYITMFLKWFPSWWLA